MRYLPTSALTIVLALGCSNENNTRGRSPQTGVTVVEGDAPSPEQRQTLIAAKLALFEALSGRLMEVVGTHGPAAAIAVCQQEAN